MGSMVSDSNGLGIPSRTTVACVGDALRCHAMPAMRYQWLPAVAGSNIWSGVLEMDGDGPVRTGEGSASVGNMSC